MPALKPDAIKRFDDVFKLVRSMSTENVSVQTGYNSIQERVLQMISMFKV